MIAHLGDRALLIHLYPYSIGDQDLLEEDPPTGFKTPIMGRSPSGFKTPIMGRSPSGFKASIPLKDWDELVTLVSPFVGFGPCISPCVCGSSTCVIGSCWFECFSRVSPLVFPRVLRVLRGIRSNRERSTPLGFHPTSSWYHEPRWSRIWSLPLRFLAWFCFVSS